MKRKLSFLFTVLVIICVLIGCSEGNYSAADQQEEPSVVKEEVVTSEKVINTEEATEELESSETLNDTEMVATEEESESQEVIYEPEVAPYTYSDFSKIMYAKQTANVRNLPDKTGDKVGSLTSGQEVVVTGQCNETSWYRIDLNGAIAYVSNTLLIDDKPVVQEPPKQDTPTNVPADGGNSGTIDNGGSTGGGSGSGPTVIVPKTEDTGGNLVWVPTNGGTKYHSKSTCSKMKDPIQVTKEHAEANGYTPCKRCY